MATACFGLLVLSNVLISFLSLSTSANLWVILVGIIAPLVLFLMVVTGNQSLPKKPILPSIPLWAWVFWVFILIFVRLFRLTTLSTWPLVDEGIFSYFATLLEEKWNWQLVHCFAQEPILYNWGQFLFFKIFGNSLTSLWLFPAVCSILCVPAAWLAARKSFGPSTGFFAAAWTTFGFWPLYMGRFSVQSILMVLWECLVFYFLAAFLTAPKNSGKGWLFGLALLTGFGFYTYLAWPVVAFMVGAALLANPIQGWTGRIKNSLLFSIIALAVALPLILIFAKDYRGYFGHLKNSGSFADWGPHLLLPLAYIKSLFWGTHPVAFSYGPLWGGLLNPVSAALFFLGVATLLKTYRKPLSLWLLGALILFSLPALLTNNFEVMRLSAILPVLVGVTALGTHSFLSFLPAGKKWWIFAFLLAASSACDFYHLFVIYPASWKKNPAYYGAHKSQEFNRAYQIVEPIAEKNGPGLILLNFNPDPYDQTLFVTTYSFNAAENSHLDPSQAKWAAILANIHEQPYLKKVFPNGSWIWLSEGLGRPDGGFILETVPVDASNKELLLKWAQADQSLKELTRLVMELGVDPDQSQMLGILDEAYPSFQGDRLLESRYWRIRAIHQMAAGHLGEAIGNEKKAITLGLPMAHLYNEIGCLLYKEGRLEESKKSFEKALRLKPNCTNAAENLQTLFKTVR